MQLKSHIVVAVVEAQLQLWFLAWELPYAVGMALKRKESIWSSYIWQITGELKFDHLKDLSKLRRLSVQTLALMDFTVICGFTHLEMKHLIISVW